MIDFSRATVQNVEAGEEPSSRFQRRIAELELQIDDGGVPNLVIATVEENTAKRTATLPERARFIPVLSYAQAGQVIDFEELPKSWQKEVATDCRDPLAFGVELMGDSMEPKYSPGEIVTVMPSVELRYDSFVVARFNDGGVVFKLCHPHAPTKTIELISLNKAYKPIVVAAEDLSWCHPVYESRRRLWV